MMVVLTLDIDWHGEFDDGYDMHWDAHDQVGGLIGEKQKGEVDLEICYEGK